MCYVCNQKRARKNFRKKGSKSTLSTVIQYRYELPKTASAVQKSQIIKLQNNL